MINGNHTKGFDNVLPIFSIELKLGGFWNYIETLNCATVIIDTKFMDNIRMK